MRRLRATAPRDTLLDFRSPFTLPMRLSLTTARLRRTMLFIVMAALLLAQTLGLVHRVVHSPQALHMAFGASATSAPPGATDFQPSQADATPFAPAHSRWLARLFAAHADSGCDSYDQLAHADFLWAHPPGLTEQAVRVSTPSFNPVWQLAAQAAGYLARGPPTLA